MKNKLFTISFIAVILLSSCSADNNSSSANSDLNKSVTQTTSSSVGTETKGKLSSTTAQTANENSGMTEQEVLDLGEKEGDILKKLYFDYLNNDSKDLAFKINYYDTKEDIVNNVVDGDELFSFSRVESSEFQKYSQLYDYFSTFCTPEYSTELLTETANVFRDIDGELYVINSVIGFRGYTASKINTYDGINNAIGQHRIENSQDSRKVV